MIDTYAPTLGTLVTDTERFLTGRVTGWDGEQATLSHPEGGPEWQARYFRPANEVEILHANVQESIRAER